ncbi:MAG: UDP-glucose--hexose-1-phosphate uridylyltransferase [Opitutales bacterium]
MAPSDILESPHRRFNPLTGEWILVSPHRAKRPWQGAQETVSDDRPEYDPKCYLCPGNERVGGERNPNYTKPFVFKNDFAALLDTPSADEQAGEDPLFRAEQVAGECRVICFSPRHDLSLPEMGESAIQDVVDVWASQTEELGAKYSWVQIFENKGSAMGCSNPHPHGQIWASDFLPNEVYKEDKNLKAYRESKGRNLLVDYVERELELNERIVCQNDDWVTLVPYWATWPFETLLLPKFPARRLTELNGAQRESLAQVLKRMLTRYDNLFETSFPYSMGWHGAPFIEGDQDHWLLHAHFYPPLLRSATVKKFMVGYEMLANAQRDLTAEQAAQRLAALSEIHYKTKLPCEV